MRYLTAVIAIAAFPAQADVFCDEVTSLLASDALKAGDVRISLPDAAAGTASCRSSLALGGARSLNCHWTFAYRSDEAQTAFEGATSSLERCFNGQAQPIADQAVNHPDFYDLKVFQHPQGEVGISLKDKGALAQTLIFLRVAPAP